MKNLLTRVIPALSTAMLLLALVSCSGNETPQGTTAAKPEEKAPVAQAQPADQQAQPVAVQQESQSSEKAENSVETTQPAISETTELTGTVMLSDAGAVIQTDQGEYGVMGKDLTDMAGKTVNIVGTLEESDGRQIIQVISVTEAK